MHDVLNVDGTAVYLSKLHIADRWQWTLIPHNSTLPDDSTFREIRDANVTPQLPSFKLIGYKIYRLNVILSYVVA
jgi:hypothetical protein